MGKIESRINQLKDRNADTILKNLIDIENKIANLHYDLDEAASDLVGYIQELIDTARGK